MPELSIVIPAYNEASRIRNALDTAVTFFSSAGISFELIVVDDGSVDETVGAVRAWRDGQPAEVSVQIITIPHAGKGGAVRAGTLAARGDYILMADADCSTPFEDWPRLAEALEDGAQVAVGSRQAPGAEIQVHQAWFRQRLGQLFGRLARAVFPIGVLDSQCGFKAFTALAAREIFSSLATSGYAFDIEALLRARQLGYKVVEVPVRWRNHPDSRVRVWRDWPEVLRELWRIRRELKDRR